MYNANPNYEMNFAILKDVNEHMEGVRCTGNSGHYHLFFF